MFSFSSDYMAWTSTIGWTLLHFLWQGAVVGVVAAVLLSFVSQVQKRYVISVAGLVAMAVLPIATAVWLIGTTQWQTAPMVSTGAVLANTSVPAVEFATGPPHIEVLSQKELGQPSFDVGKQEQQSILSDGYSPTATPVLPRSNGETWASIEGWIPWLTLVWILGVTVLSARLMLGWLKLKRICSRSRSLELPDATLLPALIESHRRWFCASRTTLDLPWLLAGCAR